MGMDRNTIIGFALIGILLIAMFMVNSKSRLAYEAEQMRIADSLERLKPKADPELARLDSLKTEQLKRDAATRTGLQGAEQETFTTLENELLKISFTNKGGRPHTVELKNFSRKDGSTVILQQGDFNSVSYNFLAGNNQTAKSGEVLFAAEPLRKNADNSQTLIYYIADSAGRRLSHTFTLPANDYRLNFDIATQGGDFFTGNEMSLTWQTEAPSIEGDFAYETTQTHVCYYTDNDFDFEYVSDSDKSLTFNNPVDWLALKQQFFASALIAKSKFKSAQTQWVVPADTNQNYIARMTTQARADVGTNGSLALQMFYGPSEYKILKSYGIGMEEIVPYGSGIFAFVKYINRHLLLPVFDFFQKHIANMGIVILLLTLFIRLITSPILYKSYLSGAKMKALKPEVDALRAKFTDPKTKQLDQQAFGMEQMKLWRSAGVNPLGGCLPALLQIPIFMSLYYFFQSNIDLRGKGFLWATDLSTYDEWLTLPFNIPFYGDHVSLFTLTATITSLLISVYSMSQMQDNTNPLMKYMPYIFPIFLLGIFNSMPSALTWYYTVSNIITLILQIVIQKYIIDHDKILARINENMKKPAKQSKLAERIQAMQEQQKKLQEMKTKGQRK